MSSSQDCPECGYANPAGAVTCSMCQGVLGKKRAMMKLRAERQGKHLDSSAIRLTTTDLKEDYEILDTLIAIDAHLPTSTSASDPAQSFHGVKTKLRRACWDLGGDAVVGCQFEYRIAVEDVGFFTHHHKNVIEVFAYGTAVRLLEKSPDRQGAAEPRS